MTSTAILAGSARARLVFQIVGLRWWGLDSPLSADCRCLEMAWPWLRRLSAAKAILEGADSWRLSAELAEAGATCPSLKGVQAGCHLSSTICL